MKYAIRVSIYILIFLGCGFAAQAQPADLWTRSFDDCTSGVAVAETTTGNIIVVGEQADGTTLCVIGLAAEGDVLWRRGVDHGDSLSALSAGAAAPTSDGGFVVGGSAILDAETVGILMRFDADGRELWRKAIVADPGKAFVIRDVLVGADGGIVAAGYSPDSYGPDVDGYVIRTDASGSVDLISRGSRSDDIVLLYDVEETADGRNWVAGVSQESMHGDPSTPISTIIGHADPGTGVVEFETLDEHQLPDLAFLDRDTQLLARGDGSLVVVGQSAEYFGCCEFGRVRPHVFELNASGEPVNDYPVDVADTTVVVLGSVLVSDGLILAGRLATRFDADDAFILKLNADGSVAYHRRFGEWWGDEQIEGVVAVGDDRFVVVGSKEESIFVSSYLDRAPATESYFPLEVGNTWTYYTRIDPPGEPIDTVVTGTHLVSDSAVVNDTTYFKVSYPNPKADTLRVDAEGRVFARRRGRDVLLFDFTAPDGARYRFEAYGDQLLDLDVTVSRGHEVQVVAGHFEDAVTFRFDNPFAVDVATSYTFAPGIGMVKSIGGMGEYEGLYSAEVGGRIITSTTGKPGDDANLRDVVAPNPSSAGAYALVRSGTSTSVRAAIYDILGRRILQLDDRRCPAAECRFDIPVDQMPSGVYFVRVTAEGRVQTAPFTVTHR